MHLSFFVGKFIILTGRRNNNNNNIFPNISTLPINSGKMKNNYINPISHSTLKRNDLLVNVKYKNTNWIKFGNIFVDEKNINRNYIIKERTNINPIYLTRFKKENKENKLNKGSFNKEKKIYHNNIENKEKNISREEKREEIKKENDNICL